MKEQGKPCKTRNKRGKCRKTNRKIRKTNGQPRKTKGKTRKTNGKTRDNARSTPAISSSLFSEGPSDKDIHVTPNARSPFSAALRNPVFFVSLLVKRQKYACASDVEVPWFFGISIFKQPVSSLMAAANWSGLIDEIWRLFTISARRSSQSFALNHSERCVVFKHDVSHRRW